MFTSATENLLAKVIAVGSSFVTVFILTGSVTDPVNVTKLLVLGVISAAAFGVIASNDLVHVLLRARVLWIFSGLFLVSASVSVISSDSPISQGVYGSYGRNNGLLTYVFLVALLLSTAALNAIKSLEKIVIWLIVAGLVNVLYCLWVIAFGDFVGWNNPYGNILGTLGNPNFIGAFLGIFFGAYLAYGASSTAPKWFKYSMLLVLPLTAFEIYDSSAIQGRVVGLSGAGIVGFFLLRARFGKVVISVYLSLLGIIATFATLGALQIGPLTSVIYKTSVSLRGQYWKSGWNTGESNPWTGVGMDSFGDWYRRSRELRALELPGVDTVVNASHNVPIDMFAFGGWTLFILYLLIMGWGGLAILRSILRTRKYDPVLTALTAAWFGYQLQSIISINQIGLATWGWVLTGAVVAYERITRHESTDVQKIPQNKLKKVKNLNGAQSKSILTAFAFSLIGLLIALPPLAADSKWRSAQLSQTVVAVEESMKISYFNPQNMMKYMTNIQILDQNNLPELTRRYALEAVKWNPEAFELWKVLYLIKSSTDEDKSLAVENMRRLDPLNPDVTSVT